MVITNPDVQDPAVLRRRVQFRQDLSGKMSSSDLKIYELCEWIENQVPMDGFKMDVQIVKMLIGIRMMWSRGIASQI